jgi:hypothetical protein
MMHDTHQRGPRGAAARATRWLLAGASLAVTGCFGTLQPVSATFQGMNNPVLLGPIDRIGGGSSAPARKVGDFEGEASSVFAQNQYHSTSGNISYETTETVSRRDASQIQVDALKALSVVGGQGEIRVTTLRTWARGWPTGTKNTVYVEGDVVDVGGGK